MKTAEAEKERNGGDGGKDGAGFAPIFNLERRRHHVLAFGDRLLVGAGEGLPLAIFQPPVGRQLMMIRPDIIIDAQRSEDRVAANRLRGKHSAGLMNNHPETIHILLIIVHHASLM